MFHKSWIIVLTAICCILLIFLITNRYDVILEESNNYPPITPLPNDKVEILLYYPDNNMERLYPEVRVVSRENEKIQNVVIKELLKGTKNRGFKNIIPENTKVLSIYTIDEVAYVSFSNNVIDKNYNEKQEAFVIYSIVNTLTSLQNIDKVQILINGRSNNILCNHYSIREPLRFSNLIVKNKYISPTSIIDKYFNNLVKKNYKECVNLINFDTLDNNIDYNILKTYLKNYYDAFYDYDISNYVIYNYSPKCNVNIKISTYYDKNNKNDEQKQIKLIYCEDKFKLNEVP